MRLRIARLVTSLTIAPGPSVTTAQTPAASAINGTGLLLNGLLVGIIITAPTADDGGATLTVNLIDQDGNVVWTKGSIAVNSGATQVNLNPNATAGTNQAVALSGYYQLQVVFSANQTSTASVTKVVLFVDEG